MTETRIKRVRSAAPAIDPTAVTEVTEVTEVTAEGTLRILPAKGRPNEKTRSAVDRWFDDDAG